mgnify:FL=1|jgi:hypothetical protein
MQSEGERILTVPQEMGDVESPLVTGNEWVTLPDISPADAGIATVNLVHMGCRGLVEWVGPEEPSGHAGLGRAPFLTPYIESGEGQSDVLDPSWTWERMGDWIPCARKRIRTASGNECALTMVICAPVGERGFVVRFELSDLVTAAQGQAAQFKVGLTGCWGTTANTIFTRRGMRVMNHAFYSGWTKSLVLEARGVSSLAALAVACNRPMEWTLSGGDGALAKEVQEPGDGSGRIDFSVWTWASLKPGQTWAADFWVAANADPDGAATTSVHLRRVGYQAALEHTLAWLRGRSHRSRIPAEMAGKTRAAISAISRADYNLHFCRFFAHGKAIDTEELVMLTSRSPRYYVSAAFWPRDTFLWAFPAMLASDPAFAREVLLTGFARHVANMGIHAHYIDGVLLYPGFELDQHASYMVALGSYVTRTGDMSIVSETAVRTGLARFEEILAKQRHSEAALYRTFLDPSDDPVRYPYLTYDNALLWRAFASLAEIARTAGDSATASRYADTAQRIHTAVCERLVAEGPFGPMFVWSADLEGGFELYDDPPGSLLLLPFYGLIDRNDIRYVNTVKYIMSEHNPYRVAHGDYPGAGCAHAARPWPMHACNMVMAGIADGESLELIAKAPLDGELACESVYEVGGKAATGGAFATFAGYLSMALTQAVTSGIILT